MLYDLQIQDKAFNKLLVNCLSNIDIFFRSQKETVLIFERQMLSAY